MIDLKELRKLLVDEICAAEKRVIQNIKKIFQGAKEDDITTLFILEAEKGLEEATDSQRVTDAVQSDLESGYWAQGHMPPQMLYSITNGLVARLRKQQPTEEARTGGDFGLMVIEPRFQIHLDGKLDFQRGGLKRGMLVQAKRRLPDGRWNQLTDKQLQLLPPRMDYTALLRYEFLDRKRRDLNKFQWHYLSDINSISVVQRWLASNDFPKPISTSEVIAKLSIGKYGTNDEDIITRDICPDEGPYLLIEIDWRDGENPEWLLEQLNEEIAREKRLREKVEQIVLK